MSKEKIRIPRKVEAKFQLFGLGWKEISIMSVPLFFALYNFYTHEKEGLFTALIYNILIVGVPYILLSQSKYGRTGLEQLIDMIKYYLIVQKRYEWSWTDEDISAQVIRIPKKETS
ncbi:hypothetical protein DZB91_24065 [Brevibacillus sp. VP]|uniref:hypothetical protein n=1 Tax=Brevibacillus sp. VP TaxID=2293326 RepID=UPI000E2F586B|nr:hypothetical protein [Brevibacillus sp. VP]RFB28279.1 hypothetical protein DZB91_24065 [Brevibacillus sp. VP]